MQTDTLKINFASFLTELGKRIKERKWQLAAYALLTLIYMFSYGSQDQPSSLNFHMFIYWFTLAAGVLAILFYDGKLHNLAFIVILSFGLINAFIMPIIDSPDEQAHLRRAYLTAQGNLLPTVEETGYTSTVTIEKLIDDKSLTVYQTDTDTQEIDNTATSVLEVAAMNPFFGYIPQAIGIMLAQAFHMNAIWMLWLGRIANLIFYAFMCRFLIKLADKFKMALYITATLPMALYQASSMSIDTSVNAYALLTIAWFIHLYYSKEHSLGYKQLSIFFGFCTLAGLCKLTFFALCLLILLVPISNFKTKKMYYYNFAFIALLAVLALGWYVFSNSIQPDFVRNKAYLVENNINAGEQLKYILTHKKNFISTLTNTLFLRISITIQELFRFGWLSYIPDTLSILYCGFFGAIMLLYPHDSQFKTSSKIWLFLITLFITTATLVIFYLAWTPTGSMVIEGTQPRYYIPLIAFMPMIFGMNKAPEDEQIKMNICLMNNFFLACTVLTTCVVYYTA